MKKHEFRYMQHLHLFIYKLFSRGDKIEKEAMSPAKIKEHEPTAVRRDQNEQKIVEGGKTGTSSEDAAEKARRSGMTKGTAGAAET